MDKKLATIMGAVGTLACAGAAQAATPPTAGATSVQSYSDLLQPVPNATEVLARMDAESDAAPAHIEKVQWHHHHHHNHYWVRRYRVMPRPYYHHHHHHHHHHHYWRRGW